MPTTRESIAVAYAVAKEAGRLLNETPRFIASPQGVSLNPAYERRCAEHARAVRVVRRMLA